MIIIYGLVLFLALVSANSIDYDESALHWSVASPLFAEDNNSHRLPGNLKPMRYDLRLIPHFTLEQGGDDFDGEVSITFQVLKDTDTIVLHSDTSLHFEMANVRVRKSTGHQQIRVKNVTNTRVNSTLLYLCKIQLEHQLVTADEVYMVDIKYRGHIKDGQFGFYKSHYFTADGEKRWLASTQFAPSSAREVFPCFDEPAMKAVFQISICLDKDSGLFAISNMDVESTTNDSSDPTKEWTIFHVTPKMSTYIVGFVVCDFDRVSDQSDTRLRILAQPTKIGHTQYSLGIGSKLLAQMENFMDLPYMLEKLDSIAVPAAPNGGMENWGIVIYWEGKFLFEEGVSTSDTRQRIATVIAHEFAHQWFGNLVTPKWWTYTWLSEGFAMYFEYFITAKVEPEWRLEEQFVPHELQTAMSSDSLDTSHPMTFDVCSPESRKDRKLEKIINYSKGSSIVRMMKHIVGEKTFESALQKYLKFWQYDVTTDKDLFDKMAEQMTEDYPNEPNEISIHEIMRTWVGQMGYPILHVKRNYENSSITLTQERFLLKKPTTDSHEYKWHIPLTYTNQLDHDFETLSPKQWFEANHPSVEIADRIPQDKWILFNIQETGYYRVNYDVANWELLTDHLVSSKYKEIHVLNRAQLVDDSFNLARAGYINYTTPLSLSLYLAQEVDYVPWISAFRALSFINSMLSDHPEYTLVQMYIRSLITTLYNEVGFTENSQDGHETKLNRAAAVTWACRVNVSDCVVNAKAELRKWMANPTNNTIKPDLRGAVYCTAVREGGDEEWEFLRSKYIDSKDGSERERILTALGCSSNKETLNRYLELLDKNQFVDGFSSVYSNPNGVDTALDFLISKWETILNVYCRDMTFVEKVLTAVANQLITNQQAEKLKQFLIDKRDDFRGVDAEAVVQKAQDIVHETLRWKENYSNSIVEWIKDHLATMPARAVQEVNQLD